MKTIEVNSENDYMSIAIPHIKVIKDLEGIAAIVVPGCGAYTVGMAQHGLPDVVCLSTAQGKGWQETLAGIIINFFIHIKMMEFSEKSEIIVEHDDYEVAGQPARFKLRRVDVEKPWQHLLMLRDSMPNDRLVQLHISDDQNRVFGEFAYDMNHSMSSVRFEDRLDFFC